MESTLSDYYPKTKDGKELIPILTSLLKSFQHNLNNKIDDMQSNFLDQIKEKDAEVLILENEITDRKMTQN